MYILECSVIGKLESEEESPPALIFFKKRRRKRSAGNLHCCKILDTIRCIWKAAMLNIGCYIVFGLEYPSICGQFLGFLQHRVVGDILTQNKCTNWINFSELYMAHIQKYSNCEKYCLTTSPYSSMGLYYS